MSDQDIHSMDDDPFPEPDILCPHSDLFLLVGPDKLPIGVDARTLRRVSNVFEAMFKPPWLESTKLAENRISPPELVLPEDDFRAMNVICCIIHHRNDLVPSDISASDILQVAIVADKYDMLTALKYPAAEWLKQKPKPKTAEAEAILFMGNLLAAAFLFREPVEFGRLSLELLFNYSGSYREVGKSSVLVDILGSELPVLLEESRTRIRTELQQMLIDGQQRNCSYCKYGQIRSEQYKSIWLSKGNGPLETLQKPISSLLQEIDQSMPSRKDFDEDLRARTTYCDWQVYCRTDGRKDFSNKLEELRASWALSYEEVRSVQTAAEDNTK